MIAMLRRETYGWTGRWLGYIDVPTTERVVEALRPFWVQSVYKYDQRPPYIRHEDYERVVAVLRLNGITVEVEE